MTEQWISRGKEVTMNTYSQYPLIFEKGEGCYLWDSEGKKYLDFVAGIAVNSMGYNNPKMVSNLCQQITELQHVSNLYWVKPAIELGEILVNHSKFDKIFYCNSGAEPVEAALKLARKFGKRAHGNDCYEVISMKQSFHGRTFGAITLTGQEKYQKGLSPLLTGVNYALFNDIKSVKQLVSEKTCAIIVEPIQGEGGIIPATKEFLVGLRKLCTEKEILLIFDEVQCGIGRTGTLFAGQYYGVTPDAVSVAKGLGGEFPIGAMLAVQKAADAFKPGDHASTFGGNALACTAGKTVASWLVEEGTLESIQGKGEHLKLKLQELEKKYAHITEIRGCGLIQGIQLDIDPKPIMAQCVKNGLLLIGAGHNVIRLVPPLVISTKQIDQAVKILDSCLTSVLGKCEE